MVNGLYIGKNALIVNQAALSVVSNNIANANTEGYSKQRVNLTPLQAHSNTSNVIQQAKLGYGVDIESISRYRDDFVDANYRNAVSNKSYYDTINSNGIILENLSNEFTGSGLSTYLDAFFTAANNISLYPTDMTMKTDFVQQGTNLANAIRELYANLKNARTDLVGDVNNPITLETSQIKFCADEINQLLSDIAKVNETIIYQHNTNVGASAGLLDKRDALLDELAQYIPITTDNNPNGSINVSLGKVQLVGGSQVKGSFKVGLGDESNPAIVSFETDSGYVYANNVKDLVGQSGKLGAILTLGSDSETELTVKSMMDNLNQLAQGIAQEVNALQLRSEGGNPTMRAAYYNPNTGKLNITGEKIFVSQNSIFGDITAENISFNSNIAEHPEKVATALVGINKDGTILEPDEIGNNTIAQAFVDLREKSINALGGQTIEDFNTSITTEFGAKLNSAKSNLETHEAVYDASFNQRESTIGVNIEEELVDLVKYQRAYESSARVFTVATEILETLVNLAR